MPRPYEKQAVENHKSLSKPLRNFEAIALQLPFINCLRRFDRSPLLARYLIHKYN